MRAVLARALATVVIAAGLGAGAVHLASWLRTQGVLPPARAVSAAAAPAIAAPARASEGVRAAYRALLTREHGATHGPSALNQSCTNTSAPDFDRPHMRIDAVAGVDYLEVYVPAPSDAGDWTVSRRSAPLDAVAARSSTPERLILTSPDGFVGRGWVLTAEGGIEDRFELAPRAQIEIACLNAAAAEAWFAQSAADATAIGLGAD